MGRNSARKRLHKQLLRTIRYGWPQHAVHAIQTYVIPQEARGRWGLAALYAAVQARNLDAIAALGDRGDVNPYGILDGGWNMSVASMAVDMGGGTLRALLCAFPDLRMPEQFILHAAARKRGAEDVELLLFAGADPLALTNYGETAADIARRHGNFAAAALIERHCGERCDWIRACVLKTI